MTEDMLEAWLAEYPAERPDDPRDVPMTEADIAELRRIIAQESM